MDGLCAVSGLLDELIMRLTYTISWQATSIRLPLISSYMYFYVIQLYGVRCKNAVSTTYKPTSKLRFAYH